MTRSRSVPVLILGAGGAGLRAALAAHEAGVEVLVLTKRARRDAHTSLAAGGVNAALGSRDPDDSPEWHFKDTYEEGYALADAEAVEILVSEAPARVRELAQWGAPFARLDSGAIDQRFFGAHRYRRTCFAGDWTGRAIIDVLYSRVAAAGIEVCDDQYVAELLVDPETGRCFGALTFDLATGEHTAFLADAVVLAAGGHTRLWRRSSSRRDENYGESMSLAARAGASLADMELVQFHPSGMTWPENVAGTLVTEAVRGEGGLLTNADGERFMSRYDPERMELSTRDRVALAAYREIRAGRPQRWRVSRRVARLQGAHSESAPADVPADDRASDARHLHDPDGGLAHGPLLDGWGRGVLGGLHDGRAGLVRGRRGGRRGARG